MATQILIKRSSTGGVVPTTGDITAGEFAVNLVDRKLYTNNGTAVVRLDSAYVDSTAPANGVEGDLWYDTANNILKTHNGTGFVAAGYTTLGQFGVTATAAELNKLDGVTATTAELNKLDGLTATTAELNYVDGVTSNIQTQLNSKASTSHNHTLDSLSNTTITSVANNDLVAWDSATSKWTNQSPSEAGFATVATTGAYSDLSGTPSIPSAANDATITLSAGTGLSGGGNFTTDQGTNETITLNVALSELATSTTNGDGDYFVVVDTVGAQKKLTKGNINLSGFNNDSGFITGYTETDTLDSVTDRGATTTNAVSVGALTATTGNFSSNVTVGGNLIVNGTTTTVNSNTVNIGDNILVLNSDETGVPSQNGGIEIERGTSANVSFLWDEANDYWTLNDQTLAGVVIDGGSY